MSAGRSDLFEELAAAALQALQRVGVQRNQEIFNGFIGLFHGEEGAVPETRENPSLSDKDRRLHLGLVSGLGGTGRENDGVIMLRHI